MEKKHRRSAVWKCEIVDVFRVVAAVRWRNIGRGIVAAVAGHRSTLTLHSKAYGKIASLQKRIVGICRTSETIAIDQLPWLNRYRTCPTERHFSKRTRNDIARIILHRNRDRLQRHRLSAEKV